MPKQDLFEFFISPKSTIRDEGEPDRPYDHCGLAGSYAGPGTDVSGVAIEMGKALQHRGQNGAGLAVKARGKMLKVHKEARAFNEVFHTTEILEEHNLRGEIAVAHLRYPTEGKKRRNCDCQPFYAAKDGWGLALAHNGSLVDLKSLYKKLKKFGIEFELETLDQAVFVQKWFLRTHTDMSINYNFPSDPSLNWFARNRFDPDGTFNQSFINDPEVNRLIKEIRVTSDPVKLRQQARFLWDFETLGVWTLWFGTEGTFSVTTPRVRNYVERTGSPVNLSQDKYMVWLTDAPRTTP